jgi:hypothetical protein
MTMEIHGTDFRSRTYWQRYRGRWQSTYVGIFVPCFILIGAATLTSVVREWPGLGQAAISFTVSGILGPLYFALCMAAWVNLIVAIRRDRPPTVNPWERTART